MGYAFISYSTKNQSFADSLNSILNKNDIETWMAPGDIPPGSKYAQVINQALKNCACLVLLLSKHSQSSHWVSKEVERAINYGKTIFPISIDNSTLTDEFEFYLSTDQIVSVSIIDDSLPNMKKVLASVKAQTDVSKSPKDVTRNNNPLRENVSLTDAGQVLRKSSNAVSSQTKSDIFEASAEQQSDSNNGCEYVTDKKFSKGIYTGQIKNGLFNGYGVLKLAGSNTYEGEFKNGEYNGFGVLKYFNGNYYSGIFINGKCNGHGVFIYTNGNSFEGEYADGKRNGHGIYKYANGDVFTGEWLKGEKHGHGVLTYANGEIFEGDWENGTLVKYKKPFYIRARSDNDIDYIEVGPPRFVLTLKNVGLEKTNVITIIRKLTGIGLAEANALVDNVPIQIKDFYLIRDADMAKDMLEEAGAIAVIR